MASRLVFVSIIVSFAAGLAAATFAPFREFLPGLLNGALITVEITVAGTILAVFCAFVAALAKQIGRAHV